MSFKKIKKVAPHFTTNFPSGDWWDWPTRIAQSKKVANSRMDKKKKREKNKRLNEDAMK